MAYSVYLVDNNESGTINDYIELDCENIDFSTIFYVSDVADISKRKDSITKEIKFKGTSTNNEAFGSLFHLNRVTDTTIQNKLFFNYSPATAVDCLIYEDSILLLRGYLRVIEINSTVKGEITYSTIITGSFIGFKDLLGDLKLEDLDLSDLTHEYSMPKIMESWDFRTYKKTGPESWDFVAFELGKSYIYPFIDYGHRFKDTTAPEYTNPNAIHYFNFKPALYVREYLTRIFNQTDSNGDRILPGFSFELRSADPDFITRFNSMIVPSTQEKNTLNLKGTQVSVWYGVQAGQVVASQAVTSPAKVVNLDSLTGNVVGLSTNLLGFGTNSVIPTRNFTSSARVSAYLNYLNTSSILSPDTNSIVKVELVSCPAASTSLADYEMVEQYTFKKAEGVPVSNRAISFNVSKREFFANRKYAIRVSVTTDTEIESSVDDSLSFDYKISNQKISFPADVTSDLEVEMIPTGDYITPQAPKDIKQFDFIKSIISLLNLYVYTEPSNPKLLIFEPYSEFYATSNLELLPSTALDWTSKIDYTNGFKIKSNIDISKKYSFNLKSDSDFINSDYQGKYSEVYGGFKFEQDGLMGEKKIDLIFSPSPSVKYTGSTRVFPAIYKISSNNVVPMVSNIRVLYYNGTKSCESYSVYYDKPNSDGTWSVDGEFNVSTTPKYPQCSNYFLDPSRRDVLIATSDLYFGLPREVYFTSIENYSTAYTGYDMNYQNLISELVNPNVSFIECNAYLNEVDISNLSLKTPVFIDMGEFGFAYFKVLEVEYDNNETHSRLKLQKITFS